MAGSPFHKGLHHGPCRRPSDRAAGQSRWPWPDALSSIFCHQMYHKQEHRVAWGRDLPSAFEGQRTPTPRRAVPGDDCGFVRPTPRAPWAQRLGGSRPFGDKWGWVPLSPLRFLRSVWERVISPREERRVGVQSSLRAAALASRGDTLPGYSRGPVGAREWRQAA